MKGLHLRRRVHAYTSRYLSTVMVLCIDLFVSLLASACALVVLRANFAFPFSFEFSCIWLSLSCIVSLALFRLLHTYRVVIRHFNLKNVWTFAVCAVGKVLLVGGCSMAVYDGRDVHQFIGLLMVTDVMATFSLLILIRSLMVVVYDYVKRSFYTQQNCKTVLIYGIDDRSVSLQTRLYNNPHFRVKGFVYYKEQRTSYTIGELPVNSFNEADLAHSAKFLHGVDAVVFTQEEDAYQEKERLITYALQQGMKVLYAPLINESTDGVCRFQPLRHIKIEDLLGRQEIKISMEAIKAHFTDRTVLITGAAGSIGSELCRQMAQLKVRRLILFDNAETPMHNLRLELEDKFPDLKIIPVVGDVRIENRIELAFRLYEPEIVFHAAAYKHVPLMEENPCEAVFVNVVGTRHVADMCLKYGVEKMIMISTDKAVNPTNVMGCTKRLAEIYVQSLGLAVERGDKGGRTQFLTTRFGNVLGSNGSVIPRFREQIAQGGPVTVTHPDIIRFFMTIPEACRLVMEAASMDRGNQIMVFDMGKPVKIATLARRMIELAGLVPEKDVKIVYTGLRPGEKLYEEVLSDVENTLPTSHDRIRLAQVRQYDYAQAVQAVEQLEVYSRQYEIEQMVRLMKQVVPEYVSNNSVFQRYDAPKPKVAEMPEVCKIE